MTEKVIQYLDTYEGYVKIGNHLRQVKRDDDFFHALVKLSYYEDLEEEGRLVELPKEFNLKVFKETVAERYCPSFFGLNDVGCEGGKSVKISACLECWEEALKGE